MRTRLLSAVLVASLAHVDGLLAATPPVQGSYQEALSETLDDIPPGEQKLIVAVGGAEAYGIECGDRAPLARILDIDAFGAIIVRDQSTKLALAYATLAAITQIRRSPVKECAAYKVLLSRIRG